MNKTIKIKCPAKINLTLEVLNKREDGFHNIKSIMQMISLYDYLTISVSESNETKILLSGTSKEIPYDETNLVYKAVKLFLEESKIKNILVDIYIEKNIPIAAGLAGGSTDAAGTIFGLNYILNKFDKKGLNELCAKLGSDLNVCLNGGCTLATSRGEITKEVACIESPVTLIKPKSLGISAKEAYTKFSAKGIKTDKNKTEKMLEAICNREKITPYLHNDLELAVFDDYNQLQEIKRAYPEAIMSGSGSTFFILKDVKSNLLGEDYIVIKNLAFIKDGVGLG